jgi:hypothetical protein
MRLQILLSDLLYKSGQFINVYQFKKVLADLLTRGGFYVNSKNAIHNHSYGRQGKGKRKSVQVYQLVYGQAVFDFLDVTVGKDNVIGFHEHGTAPPAKYYIIFG